MKKIFLVMVYGSFLYFSAVFLSNNNEQISEYDPFDLITSRRLDNMAKYIYAQHREWGVTSSWPAEIYIQQMMVGCALRDKSSGKYGKNDFLIAFDKTLDSIKKDGFKNDKSMISVGPDGIIVDGSHRTTACALYGYKTIQARNVKKFFQGGTFTDLRNNQRNVKGGLKDMCLDPMALAYCQLKPHTYVMVQFPSLAPSCTINLQDLIVRYAECVYEKKLQFCKQGLINIIRLLWPDEKWIGSYSDGFAGAAEFAHQYCKGNEHVQIIVFAFECKNMLQLDALRQAVEQSMCSGSSLIRINTDHEQSICLAQSFFNKNSVHFLNHAQPEVMESFEQLIQEYKSFLHVHNYNPELFCVCGNAVAAAYGLQDCFELEIIAHEDIHISYPSFDGGMLCNKDEIIFNPAHHFFYKGLKFEKFQEALVMHPVAERRGLDTISKSQKSDNTNIIRMWQSGIRAITRLGTIF